MWKNKLYFGDNLHVLRDHIATESIDLVYLDPPFNSKATYNVLFKTPKGHQSDAQIEAFEDSWHWGAQAESEFDELVHGENTQVSELIQSLRSFLGTNDMMAYLVMISNRLVELQRVLKPTGSIYLHCDPTASHYIKIVLDGVFGIDSYSSEVIWQRSASHGGAQSYHHIHDTILFYRKGAEATWNSPMESLSDKYVLSHYSSIDGEGRRFQLISAHGAGQGQPRRFGDRIIDPPKGRHWMSQEHIDQMMAAGKVIFTKSGMPRYKRFLDEVKGAPMGDVWTDIFPVNSQAQERLGYPTQKPLALLERIIQASSNEGDIVLDPFCGCGTAVHAAQKLNRRWIGIDITHLAIGLIERRLKDAFPNIDFDVEGTPKDLDGARDLALRDKYQFEWWACALVGSTPAQGKKKGSDKGIDGVIYFTDEKDGVKKIVVSVKGGESVGVSAVRDLIGVVEREKAAIGLFVTLTEPTKPMQTEAVSAGFYESPNFGKFPKIQILTIEGLLSGVQRPLYPDMAKGALTFKQAPQELAKAAEQMTLYDVPSQSKKKK